MDKYGFLALLIPFLLIVGYIGYDQYSNGGSEIIPVTQQLPANPTPSESIIDCFYEGKIYSMTNADCIELQSSDNKIQDEPQIFRQLSPDPYLIQQLDNLNSKIDRQREIVSYYEETRDNKAKQFDEIRNLQGNVNPIDLYLTESYANMPEMEAKNKLEELENQKLQLLAILHDQGYDKE